MLVDFYEAGESTDDEVDAQYEKALIAVDELEYKSTLNGEEDSLSAILTINAGAGGTESCDWASMLMRMYLMWGERNNMKIKELDYVDGDVAGINGMLTGIIKPVKGEVSWRILFLVGLVIGGLLYRSYGGALETLEPAVDGYWVVLAGLLVGIGATFGSGCTSGHGICGIARWSVRSIMATLTFMAAAIVTVFFIRHLLGG